MSDIVKKLSRQALELSVDERMQLVEVVIASLPNDQFENSAMTSEQKARLGFLWDEGIASGAGQGLSIEEIIEKARKGNRSH